MDDNKGASQAFRVLLVLGWSIVVSMGWLWWTVGLAVPVDGKPLTDEAIGCGMFITTGCCGSVWLVGMLAMATVYAMVRR